MLTVVRVQVPLVPLELIGRQEISMLIPPLCSIRVILIGLVLDLATTRWQHLFKLLPAGLCSILIFRPGMLVNPTAPPREVLTVLDRLPFIPSVLMLNVAMNLTLCMWQLLKPPRTRLGTPLLLPALPQHLMFRISDEV